MKAYDGARGRDNNYLIVYFSDIVDVLYGGQCYVINQDELIPTIMKKLNKMKHKRDNDTIYKIKKVKSVVKSALARAYACNNIENYYMCVVLEKMYSKCNMILKEKG